MDNPEPLHRKIAQLYQLLSEKDAEIQGLKDKLQQPPKIDETTKMEALRDFLSDFTHDIRTPIAVMKTSLYVIKRSEDLEKRNYHLNILQKQTEHLENLVDDMVSIMRLDAGLTKISTKRLNPNELVAEVTANLEPLAAEKGLKLSLEVSDTLPSCLVDRTKITRAITNVVENALNYTPTGGSVALKTYPENQNIVIQVQDTGIGIPEDDLPHIFDRFYRADKARNTQTGSSGLGLSISKSIIERHQGEIRVESAEGVGTTVRIVLPALLMRVSV